MTIIFVFIGLFKQNIHHFRNQNILWYICWQSVWFKQSMHNTLNVLSKLDAFPVNWFFICCNTHNIMHISHLQSNQRIFFNTNLILRWQSTKRLFMHCIKHFGNIWISQTQIVVRIQSRLICIKDYSKMILIKVFAPITMCWIIIVKRLINWSWLIFLSLFLVSLFLTFLYFSNTARKRWVLRSLCSTTLRVRSLTRFIWVTLFICVI